MPKSIRWRCRRDHQYKTYRYEGSICRDLARYFAVICIFSNLTLLCMRRGGKIKIVVSYIEFLFEGRYYVGNLR
jgi:hypothetical protein